MDVRAITEAGCGSREETVGRRGAWVHVDVPRPSLRRVGAGDQRSSQVALAG
jgi:hypothetical protein